MLARPWFPLALVALAVAYAVFVASIADKLP